MRIFTLLILAFSILGCSESSESVNDIPDPSPNLQYITYDKSNNNIIIDNMSELIPISCECKIYDHNNNEISDFSFSTESSSKYTIDIKSKINTNTPNGSYIKGFFRVNVGYGPESEGIYIYQPYKWDNNNLYPVSEEEYDLNSGEVQGTSEPANLGNPNDLLGE